MSQHYYTTWHEGEETTVLMGWDEPLQYYFMVIEKPSDGDELFWSNLTNLADPFQKDLDIYLRVLQHFNIEIPTTMVEEIKADWKKNVGNKTMFHLK